MKKKAIVIDREYGSGGREVARILSEKLDMEYYDGRQLASAAERFEIEYHFMEEYDEKGVGSFVYDMSAATGYMNFTFLPYVDGKNRSDIPFQVYDAQSRIIKRLAAERPCIFLGRCASEILKDETPFLNVFIYASDLRERMDRAVQIDQVPPDKAKSYIVGYPKVKLWVQAEGSDDMDVLVFLYKLDRNGSKLEQFLIPNTTARVHDLTDHGASVIRYKGTNGRLRVSMRHLDEEKSTDEVPYYTFDREEKLSACEIVPIEIEMYPMGLTLYPGEQLRLIVSAKDEFIR